MLVPRPERLGALPAWKGPSRLSFEDPLRLVPLALSKLYTLWLRFAFKFASLGRRVSIHFTAYLYNPRQIKLGHSITVQKDVWLHAQVSPESKGDPVLIIDDHVTIGRRSHLSARNHVHIHSDVMLAASVLIEDNGHCFSDVSVPIRAQGMTRGGRIEIGEGCWIGQGAAILCDKGELILVRNCVVAANAVVTRSAPPYSVISGNPARIVKQYDPAKGVWVLGSAVSETTNVLDPQCRTLTSG